MGSPSIMTHLLVATQNDEDLMLQLGSHAAVVVHVLEMLQK